MQTVRTNPRVMIGLSAAVLALAGVLTTALLLVGLPRTYSTLDRLATDPTVGSDEVTDLVGGSLTAFLLPTVIQGLATVVLTGILIISVSEAVLGRKPSIRQVWDRARHRVPALIGLSLGIGLTLVVVPVVLVAPGVALLASGSPRAGAAALVIGVPVAIAADAWIYVRLAFAAPVLLLEQMAMTSAVRRSWLLTRSSWWRVFAILLLTTIVATVANGLLQTPFAILGQIVGAVIGGDPSTLEALTIPLVVSNLGSILASTVTAPFTAAVTALLYIDLRIRREGLDVALTRAAAQQ